MDFLDKKRKEKNDRLKLRQLRLAIINSDFGTIQSVLNTGLDINLKDQDGNTVLYLAVVYDKADVLEFLLKHNADPTRLNNANQSPLSYAKNHRPKIYNIIKLHLLVMHLNRIDKALILAASKSNVHAVNLAVRAKANINAQDKRGNSALHYALRQINVELISYLVENGADVNLVNSKQETPLILAASNGDLNIIKLLKKHGASIDEQDYEGNTALHIAALYDFTQIVEFLLEIGADCTKINKHGQKPLDLLFSNICEPSAPVLLESNDFNEIDIKKILKQQGIEIDMVDQHGNNVLHWAIIEGCQDIAKLVIEENPQVNINLQNKEGVTPLMIAADINDIETVKLLLKYNAKLDISNEDQNTALHVAAARGHTRIVDLFLAAGVDKTIINNTGHTAVDLALESSKFEIAKKITECLINQSKIKEDREREEFLNRLNAKFYECHTDTTRGLYLSLISEFSEENPASQSFYF